MDTGGFKWGKTTGQGTLTLLAHDAKTKGYGLIAKKRPKERVGLGER